MIDFGLWLISMIRAICRRENIRLPNIARADELLDERLSLQGEMSICSGRGTAKAGLRTGLTGPALGGGTSQHQANRS
jgi:hypothetical protein